LSFMLHQLSASTSINNLRRRHCLTCACATAHRGKHRAFSPGFLSCHWHVTHNSLQLHLMRPHLAHSQRPGRLRLSQCLAAALGSCSSLSCSKVAIQTALAKVVSTGHREWLVKHTLAQGAAKVPEQPLMGRGLQT
jgi:hypothetical protein